MKRTFDENSTIEEILAAAPAAARVLVEFGMPCFVCGEPVWGTVGELCRKYDKDVAVVLDRLNRLAAGRN